MSAGAPSVETIVDDTPRGDKPTTLDGADAWLESFAANPVMQSNLVMLSAGVQLA